MKGKEGREHAWGGGGGMEEDGVVHPSTTKEDLFFSQEGGCRVRPHDFCPWICVAQLEELGKQGEGWGAADKPLEQHDCCWELLQPQRALPTQMAGAGVPGSPGQSRNFCLALYFTVGRRWNESTTGEAAARCLQGISLELGAARLCDWAIRKLNEGIRKEWS